jgi:CheY-like chemotaxis protein
MATVLVVDDHADFCLAMTKLIRRAGHRALYAVNGTEAIELVRSDGPDLVILDAMMPGMDGLEVLRRLRADPRTVALPVILFSAISDPAFAELAVARGAVEFWLKGSIDFTRLPERIAPYLKNDPPPVA